MSSFLTLRRACAVASAVAMFFAWFVAAGAKATLTITLPQGTVLPAGPDFATDVLKDPWDFKNGDDISPDPGETPNWCSASDVANGGDPNCFGKTAFSMNTATGQVGGTTKTADAQLGLLFTGFSNVINPGRTGLSYPIDTSKYKKLAFRMKGDVAGEFPQVFWFPISWFDPADAAVPPDFDRNFGEVFAPVTVNGLNTYVMDLTGTPAAGTAWTSAPMKGFRIDPNSSAGHTFQFNWVRLTYADGDPNAATQTINWSGGTGNATVDVYDATNTTFIVRVGAGIAATTKNWNYGVLPPGTYTLRVNRTDGSNGTATFTVNAPPSISITAPSRTSGADYATTVLGNAWDMNSASDIVVIGSENITPDPPDFTGGVLTATNTNNDPNITLLHNNNNANGTKAIDTAKYRYLTYRMQIDGPVDIGNGSIARVHWGSGQLPGNFTTTRDILVFAGMQSYTMDLATLTSTPIAPFGGLDPNSGTCANGVCTQEAWTTNRKTQLRFDPDEFGTNPNDPMPIRTFHIDDIKLTARPVSFGSYTITFAAADADGDALTLNLFRTTDTLGSNKTAIASGLNPASGQFVWNTTAVTPGEYYIYAEVSDGKNAVVASYSDAPVLVSAPCTFSLAPTSGSVPNAGGVGSTTLTTGAACDWAAVSNNPFITITSSTVGTGGAAVSYSVAANPARTARSGTLTIGGQTFTVNQLPARAPFDFDGDGKADRTVFTPGSGVWKTQNGPTRQWGLPGDIAVPGNYTGSGFDTAVYRPSTGDWFVQNMAPFNWGLAGDIPVPADYNGDGLTDAAVYRTIGGAGVFYVRGLFTQAWGLRGDIPLAGDFDGDGKADLIAYRPTTGQWFVTFSQFNYITTANYKWGEPGDIPVVGDFDGDGRVDLTIFRPSTGEWYIAFSASNYTTSARYVWGVPGDLPMALDMDGDRIDDLVVYRASDATWWTYNRVSGAADSTQFGTPGDRAASLRPQFLRARSDDFDGDGKADATVYRPSTGEWYSLLSSGQYSIGAFYQQWGLTGDIKVPGDYDGDRKTDPAVYRPSTGTWYVKFSSTNFATNLQQQWGLAGDIPVPADYDGDGRTDLAVYRPSTGEWLVRLSGSGYATFSSDQWGLPGDIPVPADYDGDGKTDLAVYRPSAGTWYIRLSSGAFGGVVVKAFGLATDVPVPSDWDGDGRADIAIYRPSTGQWLAVDALTAIRYTDRVWGGVAGDIPVAHDWDGDGIVDSVVYRPSSGQWFIKFTSSPLVALGFQWGVPPNDQPF